MIPLELKIKIVEEQVKINTDSTHRVRNLKWDLFQKKSDQVFGIIPKDFEIYQSLN